jgi:hypothetical protein
MTASTLLDGLQKISSNSFSHDNLMFLLGLINAMRVLIERQAEHLLERYYLLAGFDRVGVVVLYTTYTDTHSHTHTLIDTFIDEK